MKKLFLLLLIICGVFVLFCISFNMSNYNISVNNSVNKSTPVVIIDAGHGGFDGGASSSDGTVEKDINLKIALYVDEYLQLMGYKTILTRESDISLEDDGLTTIRAKKTSDIHNRFGLMEDFDNSVFISIHQNYYPQEKYSGMQVFYSPHNATQSTLLAESIQETTVDFLQPHNTRQIKPCTTSVYLIYNAIRPAVLVECGFLSNYEEANLLKTDDYQRKIAFSIATGIINYIKD